MKMDNKADVRGGAASKRSIRRFSHIGMVLCVCVALAGCASTSQQYQAGNEIYDPFESVNRVTFGFNEAVDQALLEPVARGYRQIVPQPARTGVRNFLRNLRTPVNAANHLLQGNIEGMAADLSRAMINTTIGLGGLIDVAQYTGLEHQQEDFGQTLAVWGVDHGPYLVLPFFGPSSVRDAFGLAIDSYADPVRLYLFNTDREVWHYARIGVTGIDKREELLDVVDDLRRTSFDYYAALRSVYMQHRAALVRNEKPGEASPSMAIPDYDDYDDEDYY